MRNRYPTIATAVTALIAQACGLVTSSSSHDDKAPIAGSAGQAGGGSGSTNGGSLNVAGEPGLMLPQPCSTTDVPLDDQVVDRIGEERIFYSWTTDEQVAELRAGGPLFSRTERPGMGRGQLFDELAAFGQAGATLANELARELSSGTFAKARYAWPNPWATVMGFPGESYGNQLLRVELLDEAWIARFVDGDLRVFDLQNEEVPLSAAYDNPGRIGAIYYESRAEAGNVYCGSFSQGGVGYREFALGNLDMVRRWSLATPEITQRLQSDIAELEKLQNALNCFGPLSDWTTSVTCGWEQGYYSLGDVQLNYVFSIGLPSELYRPTATNIEAIISALEASIPTGEPLEVSADE